MMKNTEELGGSELDLLAEEIAGFVRDPGTPEKGMDPAAMRSLLETAGHYATNNPERVPRGDPRYFMAPLADGTWIFGPSHMTVMKRAFVAAHRGMLVNV